MSSPVGKLTPIAVRGEDLRPVGRLTKVTTPVGSLTPVALFDEAVSRENQERAGGIPSSGLHTNHERVEENLNSTPFSPASFFDKVAVREGSGDEVTDVPTAHFGVTRAAAEAVGEAFDVNMSEEMARLIGVTYSSKLERGFADKVDGWEQLPLEVREGAVDAAYNMGEQVLGFSGFVKGLKSGDIEEAAKQLLDTASTEGQSSKGLARRRAALYNEMVGQHKITKVEQEEDGKLIYWEGDKELFSYRPKGGRHRTSAVGSIGI